MRFGIGTSRKRGRRRTGRLLGQSLALALVLPLGVAQVAQAADPSGLGRPDVPKTKQGKFKELDGPGAKEARRKVAEDKKTNAAQAERARAERKVTWPGKGEATLALTRGKESAAEPSGLPVTLAPSTDGKARVTVLDQKAARDAGIIGVLLTAESDTASNTEVGVDYGDFASAVGGNWSQRLRLVQLPACVLTTPEKPQCRTQSPLPSDNDLADRTVSAKVRLAAAPAGTSTQLTSAPTATVLAVTAASAGAGQSPKGGGDYSATPLSASSSWQAGGSSGSFTWSYDFTLPPAAAGPVPPLSLSYDSGSVDGRTSSTNNQGTSVGEGFNLTESYIERTYGSCDKDGHDDVHDQCWKYDNAHLVLNGKSSRLVKVSDDDKTSVWRMENDDASKVTRTLGADNGDDDGEHWTVVTGDGTTYEFGLNKLPGADTERTNSVATVAVFGDDEKEPGYDKGSAFADRALVQGWRWNLDYVEDPRGNAATYWYTKEQNYYKKNKSTTANSAYTRGGYLNRIEYGLRAGALFTDKADAKVTFGYAERCTDTDCSSLTKDTADSWPDVPFDAICTKDDDECNSTGPSFFSRKRLTGIDTSSYNATTAAYDAVDSWAFTGEYLDAKDLADPSDRVLALMSLKRTGKAGDSSIGLTPIGFTYESRPNRVDAVEDILPLSRPRISTVTSETGAITTVTLSGEECVRSEVLKAAPDTNTRSCYPQFWHPNGVKDAQIDWFHKYRVLAVTVSDPAAKNETVENAYSYSGAAWHHSDDPFTPKDERTWSDWRGYRQVTAWTGAKNVTRSRTVSLYFQGMDGDKNQTGPADSVSLAPLPEPALGAATVTDKDEYAGQLRQQVTYDGTTAISASVNDPWSKETATQSAPDAAAHVARYVRTEKSYSYTYLTVPKTWRKRQTTTTFDDYGMPVTVEDSGDTAKANDETCTRTWYARSGNFTSLVSRARTVGRTCATADSALSLPASMSPTAPARGDVLADVATVYDTVNATAWSADQTPTKGLPTWTGRATGYAATGERAPSGWQKLSATTYDALGRPLTVSDASANAASTIAYTPANAGPLTQTVTANAKQYKTTSFLDPRRGLALRVYDPNSKKTESTYDALGRLTQVWQPNRATGQAPNYKFAYKLNTQDPSWVSTSTLKRDGETYNTSYTLYDSLLRPLQTQSPTPLGGRLVTDTRYDTRGLAYESYAEAFDSKTSPDGTYKRVEYGGSPVQTQTVFDGAGRATDSALYVFGVKKWSTTTSYTGDSVATTGLEGGSAKRVITDVRGQATETRTYAGPSPADAAYGTGPGASYTTTKSAYELDGKQKTLTGPDNTAWTYTYDLFGRPAKVSDPDKGTSTVEFDVLDRPTKATDSTNTSILTGYDELSRITGTWKNTRTDANQLTGYTYDTLLKGSPTSSTRYVGGKTGSAYTQTVTAYDTLGRATNTQLQLPSTDPFVTAKQPATLAFESHYSLDGTLQQTKEPALGGLPSENIDYGYDDLGNPKSIGGATGYLLDTSYSATSQPQQLTLGTGGSGSKGVYVTNIYEEGTNRLTRSNVTDQTHPYMLQDLNYTYDQTGNVTKISDPTLLGGSSTADTQCFAYDGYQRLTEAWTPTSQNCTDNRNAANLSGPAPYWSSYTYNTAGQRTSETVHKSTSDAKTTYCYTKTAQPHTLSGTTTGTDCAVPQKKYTYDTTGNTVERPGKSGAQALTWSPEGKLNKLTENGTSTDYLYSADNTLLIRATQNGERVLYAGATELHLRADGTVWAQRMYSTWAMRSTETGTTKLTYLTADHHGTSSLSLNPDTTQTFTKRYTTPFGADRGTPLFGPWPNDKGFLGNTRDTTTGLTHIGARQYDPTTGQFLSVDPVLDPANPQTLNGYSYAANNPVSYSDPTGLWLDDGTGHNEPRPDGKGGGRSPTPGVPSGGTGSGGCYYTCGGNSNDGGILGQNRDEARDARQQVYEAVSYYSSSEAQEEAWLEAYRKEMGRQYRLYGNYVDSNVTLSVATNICFSHKEIQCSGAMKQYFSDVDFARTAAIGGAPNGPLAGGLRLNVKSTSNTGKALRARPCKCFLAGTDVLMADGKTTKNIEDVELGDKVLATDPKTGETGPREVTRLIRTEGDKNFNELSIATPDGTEHLTATHEHPFWSPSEHDWVPAGDLKPGMTLRTDDGSTVVVTGNRGFTKQTPTYNLTIDDLHTYYVLAGSTPVLVHNSGDDARFRYLDRPGFSNYTLVDASGRTYYSGMFGPNETAAGVIRRHSNNNNRFNPANGDSIRVAPGTRTYGESRLMEQRLAEQYGTIIGRSGNDYRGNRQNPLDGKKLSEYEGYEAKKLSGGC
ncbi:polymorphic toxin-type HINT domain-containing protein [Streptomyces niveiscabiei]|uniref:Polymorphic toxin-type HINT domain-containing protein n=1 Tax=Streptomyces niveiscabiei TaxID=164115 RepID=A0ABW9HI43_9ACTN